MGAPVVLRNAVDTHVMQYYPTRNQSGTGSMYLIGFGTGNARYSFMYFGRPFPIGARIIKATLRVRQFDAWAGTTNLTCMLVASKWSANRVNWNTRPDGVGTSVTVQKTNTPLRTLWEFDVTALMQSVSNGSPWYGFRLHPDSTNTKRIYSSNGLAAYRPELEIEWSDAPEAPDTLAPDGGRAVAAPKPWLMWDFTDVSGDTSMAGYQIQIDDTADFLTPVWDSGEVAASVPELNLADTTYPGLAAAATAYWRVRVGDGAGIWSDYSDVAQFIYQTPGVLTIDSPVQGAGVVPVEDSSPTILWTFTGKVQSAYQIIVAKAEQPAVYLWTSGKITSTDTGVAIPTKVITNRTQKYRITVRIWDAIKREQNGNVPTYVEKSFDTVWTPTATVTPVTELTLALDRWRPWATLNFSRSAAPDFFTILRDGKIVRANIPPEDLFVSGTQYKFVDKLGSARTEHTWEVLSVVNSKASSANPTVVGEMRPTTTTLSELDGDRMIFLFDPSVPSEMAESSQVYYPIEGPPVFVSQSIRGYEGEASGRLVNNVVPGVNASSQLDNLKYFKDRPGTVLALNWLDQSVDVVIRNIDWKAVPMEESVEYLVSFEFYQVDF